jgi:hypothetical protein
MQCGSGEHAQHNSNASGPALGQALYLDAGKLPLAGEHSTRCGGEVQLTDCIAQLLRREKVFSYRC